jgi:hypothetical protein
MPEGMYRAVVEHTRASIASDVALSGKAREVGAYLSLALLWSKSVEYRYAYPSIETIAAKLKLSTRSVDRAVAELKEAGYFKIHRGSKTRGQANRYMPVDRRQRAAKETAPVAKSAPSDKAAVVPSAGSAPTYQVPAHYKQPQPPPPRPIERTRCGAAPDAFILTEGRVGWTVDHMRAKNCRIILNQLDRFAIVHGGDASEFWPRGFDGRSADVNQMRAFAERLAAIADHDAPNKEGVTPIWYLTPVVSVTV